MQLRICAAMAVLSLIVSSRSQAAQVTVGAAKDASIFSANPNNSNGGGLGVFTGADGSGNKLRALLQFDVAAAVPPGSTITGAELTPHLGQGARGGRGGAGHPPPGSTRRRPGAPRGGAPPTAGGL